MNIVFLQITFFSLKSLCHCWVGVFLKIVGTIEKWVYICSMVLWKDFILCLYFGQILSCGVYLNTVFLPGQTVLLSWDASEVIDRNNCYLQCRLTAGDNNFERLKYNL